MHRRLAAPDRCVVETGEVVVDQGRAMQQLDRCRRGIGQRRDILAAGAGDRETQPRADPGTAREDGVAHRRRKPRGTTVTIGSSNRGGQCLLNPHRGFHDRAPASAS
jgi:hypothetical protein